MRTPLQILFLALSCLTAFCAEQQPVGYLVQTAIDDEIDEADAEKAAPAIDAVCMRNGEKVEVSDGMEIFASDVISTSATGTVAVVFLDSSAVTLRPASRIKIDDYVYPAQRAPTHLSLETGKAFFSVNPRPDDAHFFIKTVTGQVEVKGTKFEVFQSANNAGVATQVAVTSGKVTLVPNGSGGIDIMDGTMVVLSVASTNITSINTGQSAGEISYSKTNLDKNAIKALKLGAVTDVVVSTGKKNDVKISSVHTNVDGTKTFIKLTEINEKAVTTQTTVKGIDGKVISTIKEGKGKKSISMIDNGLAIKESLTNGTGKASVKEASTKKSWSGTAKILADGTEVTDCTNKKDGTRIVLTRLLQADGTLIKTKVIFDKGATSGTMLTETIYRDGHRTAWTQVVDLNLVPSPPKTGAGAQPPLPNGAPQILSGGNTVIVPDTTPNSP